MYAIKVELKLNNREKTKMNQHLGFSRFCYNYALSLYNQLDHQEYQGGSSKKIDLIKKIFTNVTKKNPDFAWTKTLSSRVYQNSFRNLKTAFSRYFQGLGKYPKYKKKKHLQSCTVDSSNGVILQEGGKIIKLPTLGTFRIKESIPKCVSQTYTVSKKGDKYYVAFAINAELIPPIVHEVFEPVGLDVNLSSGKYCVLSDGTEITYPKPLKSAITKLRKLQYHNRNKQLGNRKKGIRSSKGARKYYCKLAKLQKQIADLRNDFLQKLTTDLARKYRHLKLETLNIKGMMANKKLAFHVADASFYKFKSLLEAKAISHGGIVESVDMWYPSSKLCSQCQRKKSDLKLKDRIYRCDSPFCQPICRDLNSSINLKNAPLDKIVARVCSPRNNACGHDTADGHGLKQEANSIGRQLLLPLSN
ncbi:MAG: transposase [Xenococcaceae cyanobacterium MO_167.B27]|nr:transposase [Xenococcaceae cyanobacterium MO_167.B27]